MLGVAQTTLLVLTFACSLSTVAAFDVFLKNITIYRRHEWDPPFFENPPEVYLSCDDGRPTIDLGHVDDEHRNYAFNPGEVLATTVERDGPCIDCTLKEEDPSILKDDTFGGFPLCWHQFSETGDYIAFVPGQFRMGFQCMDCVENDVAPAPEGVPFEFVPAPEPEGEDQLDFEIPTPTPMPSAEDDIEESVGSYYEFIPFGANKEDEPVALKSTKEETETNEESESSHEMSSVTILSLCFIFLAAAIVLGFLVHRRYVQTLKNTTLVTTVVEMRKKAKK